MNRLHARLSAFARPATGFVSPPEPRSIGSFARGRQLIAGNFLFAGSLVEAPGVGIWDIRTPDGAFEKEAQGFGWLDDLAAVGDVAARARAQVWLWGWIDLYGNGRGPGWTPEITGRRLIRWINHALFLLNGRDHPAAAAYFGALAQQTLFLGRRWSAAAPGLARFEALTGLIYAGLALTGMERLVKPAMRALARDCTEQIDSEGGIPTRNPEELLEVFTLLTWTSAALSEAGRMPPNGLTLAIERIAPTLRALRHADGALARFHGGGRGQEGQLDAALAAANVRASATTGLAMGFVRMSAGRSTVIVDVAPPPRVSCSANAHASTLAFELTSGRRPVIVNCGSGASFGPKWRRAGRATPSHSTLAIEGFSSSRLGRGRLLGGRRRELLVDTPKRVGVQQTADQGGQSLTAGHDGYLITHGLTHARRLELSADGRRLAGEDTLGAFTDSARARFEQLMDRSTLRGVIYSVRFHIHPEVEAELDLGGSAVSLALKSGEIWIFRHDGVAEMTLEPSVYLEKGRRQPRATKQIVLTSRVIDYANQVNWTLAKAQETPNALRDVEVEALTLERNI